jgi:hypothetical protein
MHKAFQAQDHVPKVEFKELLICIILQINCQLHLLITKVSIKLVNPLQVYARKSGGTK